MLKLVTPENNSNVSHDDSTQSSGTAPVVSDTSIAPGVPPVTDVAPTPTTSVTTPPVEPASTASTSDTPTASADSDLSISQQPEATQSPAEPITPVSQNSIVSPMPSDSNDISAPSPDQVSPPPPAPAEPQPAASVSSVHDGSSGARKLPLKLIIAVFVFVMMLGGVAALAYDMGKKNQPKPIVEAPKPINLPKEAIIVSECTPGRGKQYIVPKDITSGGPMYDVKNDKVIAIEYTLGLKGLSENSDQFSSTILALTKNYPVDHLSVVPEPPKLGDTDQYLHLIMFVVSKAEANSIVCPGSPTPTNPSAPAATQ